MKTYRVRYVSVKGRAVARRVEACDVAEAKAKVRASLMRKGGYRHLIGAKEIRPERRQVDEPAPERIVGVRS